MQELLRPAPLDLKGLRTNNRDVLDLEISQKTEEGEGSASAGEADPNVDVGVVRANSGLVVILFLVATFFLVLPCIIPDDSDLAGSSFLSIASVAAKGVYACAVGALVAIALVLLGWISTLKNESNCWYMSLLGQELSTRVIYAVLQALSSPGAANSGNKRMARAALKRSSQLNVPGSLPAAGAVLFAGSSTFTYWRNLADDWRGIPVLNVAFGGSSTTQVNQHFRRLVKRWSPSVIVYGAHPSQHSTIAAGMMGAFDAV